MKAVVKILVIVPVLLSCGRKKEEKKVDIKEPKVSGEYYVLMHCESISGDCGESEIECMSLVLNINVSKNQNKIKLEFPEGFTNTMDISCSGDKCNVSAKSSTSTTSLELEFSSSEIKGDIIVEDGTCRAKYKLYGKLISDLSEFRKMVISQNRNFSDGGTMQVILQNHTILAFDDKSPINPSIIVEVHDTRLVMKSKTEKINRQTSISPMSEMVDVELIPGDVILGAVKKENLRKPLTVNGIPAESITGIVVPDTISFMRVVTHVEKLEDKKEIVVWTRFAEMHEVFAKIDIVGNIPLGPRMKTFYALSELREMNENYRLNPLARVNLGSIPFGPYKLGRKPLIFTAQGNAVIFVKANLDIDFSLKKCWKKIETYFGNVWVPYPCPDISVRRADASAGASLDGTAVVEISESGEYKQGQNVELPPFFSKQFFIVYVPVYFEIKPQIGYRVTIRVYVGARAGVAFKVNGEFGYDLKNSQTISEFKKDLDKILEFKCKTSGEMKPYAGLVPALGIGLTFPRFAVKVLTKLGFNVPKGAVGVIEAKAPVNLFARANISMCPVEAGISLGIEANLEAGIGAGIVKILEKAGLSFEALTVSKEILSGEFPVASADLSSLLKPLAQLCCPEEICDGKDNDGDGQIDEGFEKYKVYQDNDGDGFGGEKEVLACKPQGSLTPNPATGYVYTVTAGRYILISASLQAGDCDDGDSLVYPGAPLVCGDGKDSDCDGNIENVYWEDKDGDTYTTEASTCANTAPAGFILVNNPGDCDDNNFALTPETIWYLDADGDGYYPNGGSQVSCTDPYTQNSTYTAIPAGDCNDADMNVYPGAPLVCRDSKDNDCDGVVEFLVWNDQDGDGWTTGGSTCVNSMPPGTTTAQKDGDCDDNAVAVNPGQPEQEDGVDNNCNGAVDEKNFLALGELHSLLMDVSTGPATLLGWGYSYYGQIDNNTQGEYSCGGSYNDCVTNITPISLQSSQVAVWSAGGVNHTVLLVVDGTNGSASVITIGSNSDGQLGVTNPTDNCTGGSNPDCSLTPVEVFSWPGTTWKENMVAAGRYHTCAVKPDNTLWCWGANNEGQLGLGHTVSPVTSPTKVTENIVAVWAGGSHTCALDTSNSLWCWGTNYFGEIGNGTSGGSVSSPVKVTDNIISASLGYFHTCAIKTDNSLWCWGYNAYGQLGDGTTQKSPTPKMIIPSSVSDVAAGLYHTCALLTDSVWCWGDNTYGQIGNSTSGLTEAYSGCSTQNVAYFIEPQQIIPSGVLRIDAGGYHNCAIRNDYSVWCWGKNFYGQIGDRKPSYCVTSPRKIK